MPELVVGPGVPAGGQKGRVDTAEPEIHEKLSWPSEAHAPQLAETTSLEPSEPIVTEAQASATEQYLRDLEEAHWFSLADGRRLKSVPELVKALPDMANEVFASHVTADRNDFAAWISSSVGDTELARQLGPVKSRPEMLRILLSRVEAILRAAHGQRGGEMEERLGRVEAALKLYESIGAGNGKAA